MKKIIFVIVFITISANAFSENTKQPPVLPVIFNALPGFGVGSYLQGDTQTGNIMLVGDLIAVGMITGGFLSYYSGHNESIIEPVVCFSIGGLLYLGMKVFGIVEPIRYNNIQNENNVKLMSTGNNIIFAFSF